MRYDLHIHTSNYSPCAHSSVESVCRAAVERGLDGIALTEHDVWWEAEALAEVRATFPQLVILGGVEVTCPEGHFLVFVPAGAEFPLEGGFDLRGLEKTVHGCGGVLIWAHPFRWDSREPDWLGEVPIDALEIGSTNMGKKPVGRARKAAMQLRIATLENSDAHRAEDVGSFFNDWVGNTTSASELFVLVKKQISLA